MSASPTLFPSGGARWWTSLGDPPRPAGRTSSSPVPSERGAKPEAWLSSLQVSCHPSGGNPPLAPLRRHSNVLPGFSSGGGRQRDQSRGTFFLVMLTTGG